MSTKRAIATTDQEGMISLLNDKNELVGVIRKDPTSHKNVFYRCDEMSFEELQAIFKPELTISK